MDVTRNDTRLDGKAVVITGAGRGVGAACAIDAARLGASVVVNDVDAEGAEQVVAGIAQSGGSAVAHVADVTDRAAARGLVQRAVEEFGRLDGLVNNAALMSLGRLQDHDEQHLRRLLDVNVVGVFNCAAEAVVHMLDQGSGSIVNVTSGAHLGLTEMSDYAATKGAVASATYAWAADLAGSGVRVNALSPLASSAMTRKTQDYLTARGLIHGPLTPPPAEGNAPVVSFLLSDSAAEVNGQVVRMDGDLLSLLAHPAVMEPLIRRDQWSAADVARAFQQLLGARQAPIGMAWTDRPASSLAPEPIALDDVAVGA